MAAHKEYGKTHPEYAREYYRRNRKKMLEHNQKYREKTPEYARKYYRRNKEKMLEYGRKYRQRKRVGIT